jgi:RHS repeat-associated protein
MYDAFGNTIAETNASGAAIPVTDTALAQMYGFTGREFDKETGLQYNRARYYDPSTGRWMSKDPIGFAAGDTNLYRMTGNHPNMATDPSGLEELPDFGNLTGKQFRQAIKGHLASARRQSGSIEYRAYAVPFQTESNDSYWAVFEETIELDGLRGKAETYTSRYKLAGVAPGKYSPDLAIGAMVTDSVDALNANLHAELMGTILHMVPVGGAADYASQGDYENAAISIVGDAALGLGAIARLGGISIRAARIAGTTAAGIEGSLGVYRTAEGIMLMQKGEGGHGQIAEGLLRLVGAKVSLSTAPSSTLSRGAQLRQKFGSQFDEYARFRSQGYSPSAAKRLIQPYTGDGQHFIQQSWIKNAVKRYGADSLRGRFLARFKDSPLNVVSGRNMNTGRFYEYHARIHGLPAYGRKSAQGMRMLRGEPWKASNVSPELVPYGRLGYIWHGSPTSLKLTAGGFVITTGAGIWGVYEYFDE